MPGRISRLVIAFLVFLTPAAHAQETAFSLDARVALRAIESLSVTRLDGTLAALKALAATRDAQSGNWNSIRPPLSRFSQSGEANAAVWFARPDGSYFTVQDGLTKLNIKDRDYFPALMAGRDVAGSLVTSKSTGKKSVIVATPVMRNGKIVGALGVSLSVEVLAAWIDEKLDLPRDVVFYALDAHGQTALHRDQALMFAYPSELGDASLKAAVHTMLTEPSGVVHYTFQGSPRTVVFRRSIATGWVFALGTVEDSKPHG